MPTPALERLVHHLAADARSDGELLRQFVETRSEPAFAELVRRYGPAVFGVCRRTLGDHHLAEDTFQAVFVVLARKARTIRPPGGVGGWLYGVARKAALEAAAVRRRKHREALPGTLPETPAAAPEPDDSAELVAAEIARLPMIFRSAVLACEIEGVGRAEAARRLGIAEGTLSSRLATARRMLAARLRGRGVSLSAGLVPTAGVSAELRAAATRVATGAVELPPAVGRISEGVLRMATLKKLKWAALATALVGLLAGLGGLWLPAGSTAAPVPKPAPRDEVIVVSWFSSKKPLEMLRSDGTPVELPPGLPAGEVHGVRLSPDGKRVALLQYFDGAVGDRIIVDALGPVRYRVVVFALDANGPAGQVVAEDLDSPHVVWSRDGRHLYVSSTDREMRDRPPGVTAKYHYRTWVYDLATGARKEFELPDGHALADLSPDGTHAITESINWRTERYERYVVPLGTRRPDGPFPGAYDLRFSPDGKRVLAARVTEKEAGKESYELCVIDLDTREERPVKLPGEVGRGLIWQACWSPDGGRIAFHWLEDVTPPPPPIDRGRQYVSRVTVCGVDGSNARTIARRGGHESVTGLDWR